MSAAFGFAAAVRSLEGRLVHELALAPLALPPELARLQGTWRGEPVELHARAYRGPELRFARFVELRGAELEIGNILCLSTPALPLPILGVDLVGLGRDTAVVVADLSPIASDEAQRSEQLGVLRRHRASGPSAPRLAELPGWAERWFSDEALFTRVAHDEAGFALRALDGFAGAFTELAATTRRRAGHHTHVLAQQAAYCASHREHDRGLQLLRKLFEPALADRFLCEILFPEKLPS